VIAGSLLIMTMSMRDKTNQLEAEAGSGYALRNVPTNDLDGFWSSSGAVAAKYLNYYSSAVTAKDKWTEDSLNVLKKESKEWRVEVLYWCRKVAKADWEFESALGNISKTEMELLQQFHSELGVSWEEVPRQLS
jgi:hypothetical protein